MVEITGKIRVFVYGSLKKGHPLHDLIKRGKSEYVGRRMIHDRLAMTSMGAFPALIDHEKETRHVYGEVYVVDHETLAALDMAEGHPDFYKRRKLWTVPKGNEKALRVWTYILTP